MSSYCFYAFIKKNPVHFNGVLNFSFKARSTIGGTRSTTLPPYLATSFTILELKNEY
ncbi:Protein of unknown function [Bacillus mycoides]|nr:Protein of unknown function [Bacillus mycoides]